MDTRHTLISNSIPGRRNFLIATAVGLLTMILPWFTGYRVSYFYGNVDDSLNGLQVGAWIPFLISLALPIVFIATNHKTPKFLKIISMLVIISVIVTEAYQALTANNITNGVMFLKAGGVGQWTFIVAQVVCLFAVNRFPHSQGAAVKTNPPPLPPSP